MFDISLKDVILGVYDASQITSPYDEVKALFRARKKLHHVIFTEGMVHPSEPWVVRLKHILSKVKADADLSSLLLTAKPDSAFLELEVEARKLQIMSISEHSKPLLSVFAVTEANLLAIRLMARDPSDALELLPFRGDNLASYKRLLDRQKQEVGSQFSSCVRNVERLEFVAEAPQVAAVFALPRDRFVLSGGTVYFPLEGAIQVERCKYLNTLRDILKFKHVVSNPGPFEDLLKTAVEEYDLPCPKPSSDVARAFVSQGNIDLMATNHFPPCMLATFQALRGSHHLREVGRLALLLFLKEIGLKYYEALSFWTLEWSRGKNRGRVSEMEDMVQRKYGKAGRRSNDIEFSCRQLQRFSLKRNTCVKTGVRIAECHVCPFAQVGKDHSAKELEEELKRNTPRAPDDCSPDLWASIVSQARPPSIQCGRFLKVTRTLQPSVLKDIEDFGVQTPSQFFFESFNAPRPS
ncbi:unnamed protein product [Cyprideis torosa]|uniref:DNA primase large subunit C-terminal domain-containing protein n=1 Tax=Cyprideis torosa TaxID=163714 RepID=A0A7R8WIN9_9CRUS|nr:unnamed protein product [Cyprideis torosa]CAG0901014.1 unnamed protein product [Cyprideis torosa]